VKNGEQPGKFPFINLLVAFATLGGICAANPEIAVFLTGFIVIAAAYKIFT